MHSLSSQNNQHVFLSQFREKRFFVLAIITLTRPSVMTRVKFFLAAVRNYKARKNYGNDAALSFREWGRRGSFWMEQVFKHAVCRTKTIELMRVVYRVGHVLYFVLLEFHFKPQELWVNQRCDEMTNHGSYASLQFCEKKMYSSYLIIFLVSPMDLRRFLWLAWWHDLKSERVCSL